MWSLGICLKYLRLYFILSIKSGTPHHLLYCEAWWDPYQLGQGDSCAKWTPIGVLQSTQTWNTWNQSFSFHQDIDWKRMAKATQEFLSDNCKCPWVNQNAGQRWQPVHSTKTDKQSYSFTRGHFFFYLSQKPQHSKIKASTITVFDNILNDHKCFIDIVFYPLAIFVNDFFF